MAAPCTIIDKKTPRSAAASGLHLVVMGPDAFATHPLPAAGELTIGRGAGVEVALLVWPRAGTRACRRR